MRSYKGVLSDKDIDSLIEYLKDFNMKTTTLVNASATLKDYLSFTKALLSAAVVIPGVFVYLLGTTEVKIDLWISTFAIFLLALGVCALNQFQERHLDALMPRLKTDH